jgi:hypothetical protein
VVDDPVRTALAADQPRVGEPAADVVDLLVRLDARGLAALPGGQALPLAD